MASTFTAPETAIPNPPNPPHAFAEALQHHEAGRLAEAEAIYRAILRTDPGHADSLHLLGVAEFQRGKHADAIRLIGQAIALRAEAPVAAFHNNIAMAFRAMGQNDPAVGHLRRAAEIDPGYADARVNLGALLLQQGNLAAAEANFREVLRRNPDHADAHYNLAAAMMAERRWRDAIQAYERAVRLNPGLFDAHLDLAKAHIAMGDVENALTAVERALELHPTQDAKDLFVYCLKGRTQAAASPTLSANILRALTEPWARPSDLANIGAGLIMQVPAWGRFIRQVAAAWPVRPATADLVADPAFHAIATNSLVRAVLEAAPVCDIALERFLTCARYALLDAGNGAAAMSNDLLTFYCSLAQQCFADDYVFALNEGEAAQAEQLRNFLAAEIASDRAPQPVRLIAAASYFPLHTVPDIERLLTVPWPGPIEAVLTQQIREPAREIGERASIQALTSIDSETSLRVRQQYEESPYPRWLKAAPVTAHPSAGAYLRQLFPSAPLYRDETPDPDILIAGCGTGQNPIETARRFPQARILAIDLSLTSLAYAKRKAGELGVCNIAFAQADLLALSGRTFDMIEANGVLHHLADPWAGWRVLLSVLRPGGSMRLGLYSAQARQDIAAARRYIAERGYGPTPDGIRRARQDLIRAATSDPLLARVLYRGDFFSIGECRDMLFHVQEHRLELSQIRDFIAENGLDFIGFDLDPTALRHFQNRHPDDRAMTGLDRWRVFEDENPDIFIGMYQFGNKPLGQTSAS